MMLLPISVVIPTCDRPEVLSRALRSLLASTYTPEEFVIVDASAGGETADAIKTIFAVPGAPRLILLRTEKAGAAAQRNQGVASAKYNFFFCFATTISFANRHVSKSSGERYLSTRALAVSARRSSTKVIAGRAV